MDKNEVKGAWKETKGKVRETWGEATGSTKDKVAGKAEQAACTVQRKYGEAKTEIKRHI